MYCGKLILTCVSKFKDKEVFMKRRLILLLLLFFITFIVSITATVYNCGGKQRAQETGVVKILGGSNQ